MVSMCSMNTGWKAAQPRDHVHWLYDDDGCHVERSDAVYTTYVVGLPLNNFLARTGPGILGLCER